jgi:tetratricopeptide (TPR) repeat protein
MHVGEARLAAGRLEEAITDFERAGPMRGSKKKDYLYARIEVGRASALIGLGRTQEAVAALDEAQAVLDAEKAAGGESDPRIRGELELCRARVAHGDERNGHIENAIAAFEQPGGYDDRIDEAQALSRTRP